MSESTTKSTTESAAKRQKSEDHADDTQNEIINQSNISKLNDDCLLNIFSFLPFDRQISAGQGM